MKAKIKTLFTIILAFLIVFNLNCVHLSRAEVNKAEPTEETLKLIPDTIRLNIKESEFYDEKCHEEQEKVINSIKSTLTNAGVDLTDYDVYLAFEDWDEFLNNEENANPPQLTDIHTAFVFIEGSAEYNYEKQIYKKVKVQYSNSASYNAADEKNVKDIADIFQDCWTAYNFDEEIPYLEDSFEDFLAKYITDKTVTCKYYPMGMGFNLFSSFTYMQTLFFKNDVCYAVRQISYETNRMITIPENIKDTEKDYINYAFPILKEEIKNADFGIDDFKLERQKGNGNWYNILVKDDETNEYEIYDYILIKKENTPLCSLGDVDLDGDVDAQDAVMILKHVAHNIELTYNQSLFADTNKDEKIDAQDAVQILKLVAHNITNF